MEFTVHDRHGQRFIEGAQGQPLIKQADQVTTVLEACLANGADRLLLYPSNFPARFFDLSSGEAGAILQKLRLYGIRLAVVRSPTLQMSRRFGELLADEQRGPYVRLFDTRDGAEQWLCSP